MNAKFEGLTFDPWVPEAFYQENNPYGRFLILGESHYTEDEDYSDNKNNNFTSLIIKGVIDGRHNFNFYRNLG